MLGQSVDSPGPAPTEDAQLWLPVLVSAGADQEILRGYPAQLDGRATWHPAGKVVKRVQWTQKSGPLVYLSNYNNLAPTFIAPLDETELSFTLDAQDDHWQTSDEVRLFVRREPSRLPPRVAAGANRYVEFGERSQPSDEDIEPYLESGVETSWELMTPEWIGADPEPEGWSIGLPDIYRLDGVRDGLSSAPDYLLLRPFDSEKTGQRAPTSSLVGPEQVLANVGFELDAGASSDTNGDRLRWRWEQTRGDPLMPAGVPDSFVWLTAPARPQEIAFRVFVRDEMLESAPAEVRLIVSTEAQPIVMPGTDQRARPDREVVLDALGGLPNPSPPATCTFTWVQTRGAEVTLTLEEQGRIARFEGPVAPDELAFAVVATDNGLDSNPAVVRVTMVEADDNLPPP